MKIELNECDVERIARRVAELVGNGKMEEEYISTKEAAKLLSISPDRMRKLKDRFPHIKQGDNVQGKLLFLRRGLTTNYVK